MKLREISYLVFVVLAPSPIFYLLRAGLREKAESGDPWASYFLTVMPNVVGAFSLGGALFLTAFYVWKKATRAQMALAAAAVSIAALSGFEVLQFFLPKKTFDWHDLAWTIIGAALYLYITRGWFATGWNERNED